MQLENQVCSLELARKLKELGVKQESFFRWESAFGKGRIIWPDYHQHNYIDTADVRQYHAAFTVAELGEMLLPHFDLQMYLDTIDGVKLIARGKDTYREYGPNEADARAKILIYLIENKLVTLPS